MLKTRPQVHFLIEPNLGLLVCRKANLLPLARGEEKHSVHHKAPMEGQARRTGGPLVVERPERPSGFQGNV